MTVQELAVPCRDVAHSDFARLLKATVALTLCVEHPRIPVGRKPAPQEGQSKDVALDMLKEEVHVRTRHQHMQPLFTSTFNMPANYVIKIPLATAVP